MTELLAAGKEEWNIFTKVSVPKTEEEWKSEENGEREMEEEKVREKNMGGPVNVQDGNTADVHHGQTMVAQPGTVPAIVPATATSEEKKEEEGGGLVSKVAKMAFAGLKKHREKKKQHEQVEQYREKGAVREEVREEEAGEDREYEEEEEEEEEEGSSSGSEEEGEDEDEDEDEEEEEEDSEDE